MKNLALLVFAILLMASCEDEEPNNPGTGHPPETFEVAYGEHPLQTFKLQTPEDSDENTKIVLLIHGGGWVMGYHPDQPVTTFKGRYNWDLAAPLLAQGFAVLTMKYRTACYNTQPAAFNNQTTLAIDRMMEDINLAVDEVIANAATYRVGNNHFQLVGESGGGHIVMYYGISDQAKLEVKSVVSMFGPTNLDAQDFKSVINSVPLLPVGPPNYFLKKSDNCTSVTNQQVRTWFSLKSFADHDQVEVNQPNAFLDTLSTTFAPNLANEIPLFVTHGVDDPLVPFSQAEAMISAYEATFGSASCSAEDFSCQLKLGRYENCGHGWTGGNCARGAIMQDIVNWLEQH